MRPKRTRRDRNQGRLIKACRRCGMVVWDLSDLGGKVLDLLVCWRGRCLPVEVKAPGQAEDLTDGEARTIEDLRRVGVRAIVAERVEDVLEMFA